MAYSRTSAAAPVYPLPVHPKFRRKTTDDRATYRAGPEPERSRMTVIAADVIETILDRLGASALACYVVLERHANAQGVCYRKQETLAAQLKLSERQVRTILGRLEEAGFVERRQRANRFGMRTSDELVLPFHPRTDGPEVIPEVVPEVARQTTSGQEVVDKVVASNEGDTPLTPQPPPSEPKPKAKRKTPLPDDFAVTDAMRSWAVEKGVPAEAIDGQTEQFRDHHRLKGTLGLDWVAGWQNWMRRAVEWGHVGPNRNGRAPVPSGHRPAPAQVERGNVPSGEDQKARFREMGRARRAQT